MVSAPESGRILGWVSSWTRLRNWPARVVSRVRAGSVSRTRTARPKARKTMPLPAKSQRQVLSWARAEAATWPVIPATRKAVAMAPTEAARCFGAVASVR